MIIAHNHATLVREQESERRQYHDSTNLPLMVSLLFALQHAGNTMKNTIDDADYIIDWIVLIIIIQCVTNSGHSHSIVNEPFLLFNINGLIVVLCGNTMKNTMLRKSFKMLGKIAD